MLIIERKAKEFPPDGRIPADDPALLERFAQEVAEVAVFDPALEDMPISTLAEWIEHPREEHTFAYLTDAVRAAQRVQRAAEALRPQRPVPSGRPVPKPSAVEKVLLESNSTAVVARKESLALQNCGKTAGMLLLRIDPQQEKSDKDQARRDAFYGQADVERLRALLTRRPDAGQVLLLDCTLVGDHSFVLEIHPDGRRYLLQSYQGAYSLHWWVGMEGDEGLFLTHDDKRDVSRFEADRERVVRAREEYGRGRPIAPAAWDRFVTAMVEGHRTGSYEALAAQWTTLPFAPTEARAASIARWQAEPQVRVIERLFTGLPAGPGSVALAAIPPKQ